MCNTLRLLSSRQSSINDGAEFRAVADAMKVIGFTGDEVQTVYKILATILHLVTFNRSDSSPVPPSVPSLIIDEQKY